MVVPAWPQASQPWCICRAGGRSPKSQPAEHLAAKLRVQQSCFPRLGQGVRASVWCECWDAWL